MKFIIRDDRIKQNAISYIKELDYNPIKEIKITPFKNRRSLAQNKLLWKWLEILGKEKGYTKDEMHIECKIKYFGAREIVALFRTADKLFFEMLFKEKGKIIDEKEEGLLTKFKILIPEGSTSDLSIIEMVNYLDLVEMQAMKDNILLPHTDYYSIAMKGEKK